MTPLQQIKDRCRIDDITGCWIWTGAVSHSNHRTTATPRIYTVDYTRDPSGQTKTTQTGNRAAWHAFTGRPIPRDCIVFKTCCNDTMCVNPAHMRCGHKSTWGQSLAQKGTWKKSAARISANRATGRARCKLTPAQVREVLASSEPGTTIGPRLGVSHQIISKVRRRKVAYARAADINPWGALIK